MNTKIAYRYQQVSIKDVVTVIYAAREGEPALAADIARSSTDTSVAYREVPLSSGTAQSSSDVAAREGELELTIFARQERSMPLLLDN